MIEVHVRSKHWGNCVGNAIRLPDGRWFVSTNLDEDRMVAVTGSDLFAAVAQHNALLEFDQHGRE